ncbi:MAG: phenylalanine--tRNA ligase subunit beta [Chitinophagaceae bacterium]
MTISYKWLSEYLPVKVDPERLSRILTSIGLEVESMEKYEEAKGGLKGLLIGEVLSTEKHPDADKLTLTKVNIGNGEPLQIVCGAPNVAAGQKVIVAPVGVTIYPTSGDPMTMKVAKIRNVESYGMICAEDEIGLGTSHAGILVLPKEARVGTTAVEYFKPYEDWIYEISLTPNRMDAMSHWGVARDVCAYLSYHDKKGIKSKLPTSNTFKADNNSLVIEVKIENEKACPRYSGVSITNINIEASPKWLQQKLKAIGLRPINNIVDITNYIQHETGQPLHAFDADAIAGKKVVVKNLPEGTKFLTLDEKERKLSAEDLMICNEKEGMCIAGVFGGLHSGVTETTKNIFLESACFDPVTIRKTSFRHGLRTDAASRFEKGTDISATVNVLKRAAILIKEICGGKIASDIIDIYPQQNEKTQVAIKYHYLKKLSGKNYHPDAVKDILMSLEFEIVKEGIDEMRVAVPFHKPDISLPADLVEEVLRIDGLDNVIIPESITITPSVEENYATEAYKEKTANYLAGLGFYEIMTNSITNSAYFTEEELASSVKMLNNLSAELNILRPSMLETGLEAIAHNLNRKNNDLLFFEFGKTYSTTGPGLYTEPEHLCLYITGKNSEEGWRTKSTAADFYTVKGIVSKVLQALGISINSFETLFTMATDTTFETGLQGKINGEVVVQITVVNKKTLSRFDIKQPVFFADLNWDILSKTAAGNKPIFFPIPKYPSVQRDLAIIVPSQLFYVEVEKTIKNLKLNKLQGIKLFDIFESDKLGADKKSMAVNFTFLDEEKTLTDQEIDGWMNKIMVALEKDLGAEIRK